MQKSEYDTELYGDTKSKGDLVDSIDVGGEQANDADDIDETMKTRRTFLRSFTAPEQFLQELKSGGDDDDPFKDFKKKTIADREDDYKRQWRKRKISPPRLDPFKATKNEKENNKVATTYKDVLLDTQLEKERKEVLIKIAKKQREEKEEKQKEDKKRKIELKEKKKKEKKRKHESSSPSPQGSRSNSRSPTGSPEKRGPKTWVLKVRKNGEDLETLELDPDWTYTLGRGDNADIRMEHESISKNHAKIALMNDVPNLMDLNSTNGSTLNGKALKPGEWEVLKKGDVLKFGCSTREYVVKTK